MPTVEIPFIGPAYSNREVGLSGQVARNMWPEINPEARNQVCLHNTAGLRIFATLEGVDRGMHDFNNLMYAVNGQSLYSIDADGVNLNLGTIPGTDRCQMANDSTQLIIVTGDVPYRYTVAGGVEAIIDVDLALPTTIGYMNRQFVLDNNAGIWGEFVTSSIDDEFAIDALDFAVAESHPDDLVSIVPFRQLMYLFGSESVEPWQNTGQGNPPWARLNSGIQPHGIAGRDAITVTPEFMYFLDNKRIPRRSNGSTYQNIGNPPIGVEFAKYTKIDDCICLQFTQDNQQFIVFTFPTANRTWCFHEASGTWFDLTYGIGTERHRMSSAIYMYGLNYVADHTNGLIYEYSLDIFTDNGESIIKERDTADVHGGLFDVPGKTLFFDQVEFVIISGPAEVEGTGLGPQPTIPGGLCGSVDDLTRGQLLSASPLSLVSQSGAIISENSAEANEVSFEDSKVFSMTCALVRESPPTAGVNVGAMEVTRGAATPYFGFYMDENGYMNIYAENAAEVEILNVQITNNGGSFATSTIHMFGIVIDLSDSTKREIYINNRNVTESSWVTWNTYTDDYIKLADNAAQAVNYSFGRGMDHDWGSLDIPAGSQGPNVGIDCLGYMSFDDDCTLIPSAIWDVNGWVTDPQSWEGWYLVQPAVFYAASFWRNSGWTQPLYYEENDLENAWEVFAGVDLYDFGTISNPSPIDGAILNFGIGGTTQAVYEGSSGALPPAPEPEPDTEIVEPFWENTGNWIDLSKLTQTTFAGMFGVVIEGADFNSVFAVDKAALVNTGDDGNRLQIQDSLDCDNAAMYVTDSSGNVVDTMLYLGEPSGDSVLVQTGANYYVVVASDTGNAKVKKWDTTEVSIVGSVSWESYFGTPFQLGKFYPNTDQFIPAEGLAIRFTIPMTSAAYSLKFTTVENTTITTTRSGAVNQTVLDFSSGATHVWGESGGINCGINFPGTDIDLIPGETYFFNIRNDSPTDLNLLTLQVLGLAQ